MVIKCFKKRTNNYLCTFLILLLLTYVTQIINIQLIIIYENQIH